MVDLAKITVKFQDRITSAQQVDARHPVYRDSLHLLVRRDPLYIQVTTVTSSPASISFFARLYV